MRVKVMRQGRGWGVYRQRADKSWELVEGGFFDWSPANEAASTWRTA